MASSVNPVKAANNFDKLSVEGCVSSVALSNVNSHTTDHALTPELRSKVFGNALIKDIIFDYVFTDSNGKLSIKDVRTCRQVEKAWLDYASYRLQKAGSPQFTVDFEDWDYSRDQQKMLQAHKFLDTWANTNYPEAGSRIPLFNLNFDIKTADKSYIESCQDLKNILTKCANGLHRLYVRVRECSAVTKDNSPPEGCVPCFGQIHLPKLQNLEVRTLLPFNEIHTKLTTNLLKSLVLANSLPNLTNLWLTIPLVGDVNGVIFKILDRLRAQLKHLTLFLFLTRDPSNKINFPVMPKLEHMGVCTYFSKLWFGAEQSQKFPSLKTLILTEQTSSTLESWIQNLHFNSVKSLTLHTCLTRISHENILTSEMSLQLHTSFPLLQELDIAFTTFQNHSIRNIFQRMVKLRKLSMRIMLSAEITETATWDAILVGVTPEYAAILGSSSDQWDSINMNDHRMTSHSIINLTHLESLTLIADKPYNSFGPIISDVPFWFAFLCMPKLHELTFRGKFGASENMMQQWRARGCMINCSE